MVIMRYGITVVLKGTVKLVSRHSGERSELETEICESEAKKSHQSGEILRKRFREEKYRERSGSPRDKRIQPEEQKKEIQECGDTDTREQGLPNRGGEQVTTVSNSY